MVVLALEATLLFNLLTPNFITALLLVGAFTFWGTSVSSSSLSKITLTTFFSYYEQGLNVNDT